MLTITRNGITTLVPADRGDYTRYLNAPTVAAACTSGLSADCQGRALAAVRDTCGACYGEYLRISDERDVVMFADAERLAGVLAGLAAGSWAERPRVVVELAAGMFGLGAGTCTGRVTLLADGMTYCLMERSNSRKGLRLTNNIDRIAAVSVNGVAVYTPSPLPGYAAA